jgi:hypothetical protein
MSLLFEYFPVINIVMLSFMTVGYLREKVKDRIIKW